MNEKVGSIDYIGQLVDAVFAERGDSRNDATREECLAGEIRRLRREAPLAALKDRVVHAACGVIAADAYKHPMLSREDAVKAGVAELCDAVNAYHSAQSPAQAPR